MMELDVIDIVPSAADSPLEKPNDDVQSPAETPPSQLTAQNVVSSQPASQPKDLISKVTTQAFQLHMRNQLLDVIEELRMRRVTDVENEDKTKLLVNDKHLLQNTTDELKQKIKCLQNEQNDKVNVMRAKFEAICKESKAEKNKLLVNLDTKEKELKNLKDEIRSMQLSKYSLEKKLEELERKHHVHSSINENKLVQVDKLEESTEKLAKKFTQLTEHQDRLGRNVKEAARLHNKLLYVNTHKDCEIKQLINEVDKLKKEVSDCHVKLHTQQASDKQQLHEERDKASSLSKQMQLLKNELEQSKRQAEDYSQDKVMNLQALKESHELLDRQVVLCNKTSARAAEFEQKLKETAEQLELMKHKYDDKAMELEVEKAVATKDAEEWKEKEESLVQNGKQLEEKEAVLSKSVAELDALNNKWSQKNAEFAEKNKELQAYIDRPRVDVEMQSDYYLMLETVYVQTEETETETCSVQTEIQTDTAKIQTEELQCETRQCQTDELRQTNQKIQTEEVRQNHFQVQVEMEPLQPVHRKRQDAHPAFEDAAPLSSSQPISTESHVDVDIEVVSSSQPISSSSSTEGGGGGGASQSSPAATSHPHNGGGDSLDLSPYSRFQQTLKKLGTVTKRRQEEEATKGASKKSKLIEVTEETTTSSSSSYCPAGQRGRSSFKLNDDPDQEDVIPPTQGAATVAGPAGILQNQAVKKRQSAKKVVTFSSQLEEKKEFYAPIAMDPMSLDDEDEISLFSDDDTEKFEISTQVSNIEDILKRDRLKGKKS